MPERFYFAKLQKLIGYIEKNAIYYKEYFTKNLWQSSHESDEQASISEGASDLKTCIMGLQQVGFKVLEYGVCDSEMLWVPDGSGGLKYIIPVSYQKRLYDLESKLLKKNPFKYNPVHGYIVAQKPK